MTDFNQFHESLDINPIPVKPKLPDMLNVLTILTFIGCGLQFINGLFVYFTICSSVKRIEDLSELSENNPFGNLITSSIKTAELQCENKMSLFIASLVFGVLCLIGAIMMRKLKKNGFYIYTIGVLALPVVSCILLSSAMGIFSYISGFFFPVLFVILYATQLKHLK